MIPEHPIKYPEPEMNRNDLMSPVGLAFLWLFLLAMCGIWFVGAWSIITWIIGG